MHDSTIELMRQLIQNRCVNDGTVESGEEFRSVDTLIDYFGVPGEIIEPEPGRQSLVYRIPGSDPSAPSLALVPHLDVVPVNPSGWSVDPFAAEISDGMIFGRGAVDMLNLTSAMATAARPYITGEKKLPGDFVFAAVADEENSGILGAKYIVDNHWDLVKADYLLTEVAYPAWETASGPVYPISVGEKGPFWTKMSSEGSPGHGSAPYGSSNAIESMSQALAGLFATPMPVAITDEWRQFVAEMDLDEDLAAALLDPDRVDGAIDSIAVDNPNFARYVHAATHLTVSPNMVTGGIKTNVVPDSAEAHVDLRALPGMDRDFVDQHLRKAMGNAGDRIDLTPIADHAASTSSQGNKLWDAIVDGIEDQTGSRRVAPALMTVATDARFWRERGTIAYGVGLFDDRIGFSEFLSLFHGHDERVSVESVRRTTALLESVLDHYGGAGE